MTLRCKAGDIAVVLHDTPECASNIGRFVRILGSLEFSGNLGKWCWLIVPVGSGLWMVERGGRVSPERVTNRSRVEHPDDWLLLVGNDNDFITRRCVMRGEACDSPFDNDNRLLVYRLTLPTN